MPNTGLLGFLGGFCLVLPGCWSGSDGRIVVDGQVLFQGQPVEIGQIRFVPMAGTTGPVTISRIEGGEYSTAGSKGVPVGQHRVEITAYDPQEYANAPAGPGVPPIKQLLPEKYNRQSKLIVTLKAEPTAITQDFLLVP